MPENPATIFSLVNCFFDNNEFGLVLNVLTVELSAPSSRVDNFFSADPQYSVVIIILLPINIYIYIYVNQFLFADQVARTYETK
mgnify:CR=1 FL=1